MSIDNTLSEIERVPRFQVAGRVTAVKGLLLECAGVENALTIGAHCKIETAAQGEDVICEVVGLRNDRALLMPFGELEGVGTGSRVIVEKTTTFAYPDESWLGRVIDPMGRPLDGKGPLSPGRTPYPYRNKPPLAHTRQRVEGKIDLGVRVLNTFLTCCRGQRLGIFSGSGVGKSILMSMLARFSTASVNVIGLVGERGREVQEFIQDDLGVDGLAKSVVVVATSDQSALMRRQAAYMTMSIAEYFRDQDNDVLCLIDSITRFAMSQREVGLSGGEPPTSKGYTPTVFAELPKLLERAGPGTGRGSITGLFSVLVEGDDTNEPISDAVRGILDGHIVLDRKIAERGRFPAVNVLRSVSRSMPNCNSDAENALVSRARAIISTYEDMAEMIRLGAYRPGSNPAVDEAMQLYPRIENFIRQKEDERARLPEGYAGLAEAIGIPWPDVV